MSAVSGEISAFAAIILALLGVYFLMRILVLLFTSQIDLATCLPGALADLAEQAIYMLLTLALAANAQAIGRAFAALAEANKDALLSGDLTRLSVLITPTARLVVGLAANLAIAFTLMAVVYIALKGQIANLLSSSEGLARSVMQVATALVVLGFGILALVIGRSMLLHWAH